MKPFTLSLCLLFFCTCKYSTGERQKNNQTDTIATHEVEGGADSADDYPDNSDTIVMVFKDDDTLHFSKAEIDSIRKYYPEIDNGGEYDAETAYAIEGRERALMSEVQKRKVKNFSSEAGHDEYCMVYGYFLRKRHGEKKFREQRGRIIEIFRCINDIHGGFNVGATYFGHQYKRIEGYGEYAVDFMYNKDLSSYYEKQYPVNGQKKLFIASLKQFISDEAEFDIGESTDYKNDRKKAMFKKVDKLDSLITNYFYLRQAMMFEYTFY
jgi:hypothetical protein